MDTKICTNPHCPHRGAPQPLSNFYRQASQKSGLTSRCKTCIKAATSAYSKTERGRTTARKAQRKITGTDKRKVYTRDWARAHYIPRPPKPRQRKPLLERFWSKVEKGDGCWLWIGTRDGKGYGMIHTGGREGKYVRAHRLSWEIHFGPIPPGLCVLHHCDTPRCVRPDHLFLGTMQDNTRDMLRKGRNGHGPGYRYK